MPLSSILILALIVSAFLSIAVALLWADFQTRRPNE
jgi:hypothetical protein